MWKRKPPGCRRHQVLPYTRIWQISTKPCRAILVGAAAVANECRGDIRAMCGDVQPGGGRIEACLQANFTNLSATPCVDVMARTVGRGE